MDLDPDGVRQVVTTWGHDDAALQAMVRELALPPEAHVALLGNDARAGRLRITGPDETQTASAIDALQHALGKALVSPDGDEMEEVLTRLLLERELQVSAAESLTAGLIASRLSEPPDAGEVFAGSVVAYHADTKYRVLGVPEGPVVCAAAAAAMAEGACRVFDTDTAVSATGVAGPARQEGKPVGTVFVAASLRGRTRARSTPARGSRDEIRQFAATSALNELRLLLLEEP